MKGSTIYDFSESFEAVGIEETTQRSPSPNLYPDLEVGQSFVSPHSLLWRVEVLLGTHQRVNCCTICFLLREDGPLGAIVARASLSASAVEDGSWHSLEFPPIEESAGKRYHLSAYSPDSGLRNALCWWRNPESTLADSPAWYNGRKVDGTFCFRTFHVSSRPVWENLQLLKAGYAEPSPFQRAKPVRLVLELTSRCNLKCRMCRSWKDFEDRHKKTGHMSDDVFRQFLRLVPTAMIIQPQGWGESLVHPRFFPYLREIRRLNPGAVISFNTNGMLLNEPAAEQIIELGVSRVCFSLDSSKKEVHQDIRHGASFDRILQNMRGLVRLRGKAGGRPPVLATHMVLMRENINELQPFFRLCHELGVEEISLGTLYGCDELQAGDLSAVLDDYLAAREFAAAQGMTVYGSAAQKFDSLLAGPGNGNDSPASRNVSLPPCCDPWELVFCEYTGNVRPCCNYLGLPISGNTGDDDIGEIWNGTEQRRLRDQLLSGKPVEHCLNCMGGLFAAGRSVVRPGQLEPMRSTGFDQRNPYSLTRRSAVRRKLIYPLIRRLAAFTRSPS